MKIAVAGGTGLVGKFVVTAAENRGHEVVSISRRNGIDLISGEGLAEALDGVDVVIDGIPEHPAQLILEIVCSDPCRDGASPARELYGASMGHAI